MSAPISYDKTPKYTVKEVAEMTGLSTYTVRYYENSGLIPGVDRTGGNIRMFSDYNLGWLRLVHCLRATGLSIDRILHYIRLCFEGDSTIAERAELIFAQEKVLRDQLDALNKQMEVLQYKKKYYQQLLDNPKAGADCLNPLAKTAEPAITPQK